MELRIIRQDPAGAELVVGAPRVKVVDSVRLGGVVDTLSRTMAGPTRRPRIWYAGEPHAELILHRDPLPDKILLEGGEGTGKTRMVLGRWLLLRAIEFCETGLFRAGGKFFMGATAPTRERLGRIWESLVESSDPAWFLPGGKKVGDFVLRLGCTVQLRSAHVRSKEAGSPIQGYSWIAHGGDEGQDHIHADADISARGRSAPGGRYRQCVTASVKDFSRYRNYRDEKKRSPLWHVRKVRGPENPLVSQQHWRNLAATLSKKEYARRVNAEDVRGDGATYPSFERVLHLRPRERSAKDVSAKVLSIYQSYCRPGAAFLALVGHDPGALFNTSVVLRPTLEQRARRRLLVWRAVGEFVTKQTTQDQHAGGLKRYLQTQFGLNWDATRDDPDAGMERALVICDPHGNGEKRPDQDEYHAFRKHGLDIFSASPSGVPIKRKTRIEVMNRLMLAENGDVRFVIDLSDEGKPAAPTLLTSIEDALLDDYGIAENVKKDITDTTHAGTACGFALFPFERELFTDYTQQRI